MTNNFNILVKKLNSFRLKFYTYKLLKGLVFTVFILLLLFTVFSVVEYFVYLSTDIRKIIFFGFLIFILLLFLQFITLPVLKLIHILKPIDNKSTSVIIQQHFSQRVILNYI